MTEDRKNSQEKRYYSFDRYLKEVFGKKGVRVSLDGGFGCPNRDGKKGRGGCVYCSSKHYGLHLPSLSEQYELQREMLRKKWKGDVIWIPYLQSGSGTYADADTLNRIYEEALSLPEAAGLIVATRADCIDEEAVRLLRDIDRDHFLIVELGMQSAHDMTLERINRGETHRDFLAGYNKLDGLRRVIHIINGLPGETREDMLSTAEELARLRPFGVKMHLLHVLKDTPLEAVYNSGDLKLMTLDEYVAVVIEQLRILPPETVICRLTGDGWPDELVAPEWSRKKFELLNKIDFEMIRLDCRQGDRYRSC